MHKTTALARMRAPGLGQRLPILNQMIGSAAYVYPSHVLHIQDAKGEHGDSEKQIANSKCEMRLTNTIDIRTCGPNHQN